MENQQIKKIIAGIAILGSIVSGIFVIDRQQEVEIKQMRINLIEKLEQGNLTYDEYLQLIIEYNIEINKTEEKDEKFKLKNINKNNSIIKEMNKKIIE